MLKQYISPVTHEEQIHISHCLMIGSPQVIGGPTDDGKQYAPERSDYEWEEM